MFSFMLLPSRSVWMSGNVRIEAVKQHHRRPIRKKWLCIISRFDARRIAEKQTRETTYVTPKQQSLNKKGKNSKVTPMEVTFIHQE